MQPAGAIGTVSGGNSHSATATAAAATSPSLFFSGSATASPTLHALQSEHDLLQQPRIGTATPPPTALANGSPHIAALLTSPGPPLPSGAVFRADKTMGQALAEHPDAAPTVTTDAAVQLDAATVASTASHLLPVSSAAPTATAASPAPSTAAAPLPSILSSSSLPTRTTPSSSSSSDSSARAPRTLDAIQQDMAKAFHAADYASVERLTEERKAAIARAAAAAVPPPPPVPPPAWLRTLQVVREAVTVPELTADVFIEFQSGNIQTLSVAGRAAETAAAAAGAESDAPSDRASHSAATALKLSVKAAVPPSRQPTVDEDGTIGWPHLAAQSSCAWQQHCQLSDTVAAAAFSDMPAPPPGTVVWVLPCQSDSASPPTTTSTSSRTVTVSDSHSWSSPVLRPYRIVPLPADGICASRGVYLALNPAQLSIARDRNGVPQQQQDKLNEENGVADLVKQ